MTLRNHHWYAKNETRSYPLDDAATLLDDAGRLLPHNLLVDLYLRFPGTYGKRAFLSSLTVSPGLVTLTFQGSAAGFQPLSVFSLARPVTPYRQYDLTPYVEGVGGWLTLGGGVEEILQTVSYRFSTPAQGLLLARSAWHYRLQPSRGLHKEGTTQVLRGLVTFSGGSDMQTSLEEIEIEGQTYQAIAISLKDDAEASERNLLQEYAGECGRRPESRSCRDPQPIEFINDVGPDCCGDLYVEFRGCAEPYQITNGNGVVVSCDFGLTSACVTPSHLPDAEGNLPNDFPDLCESETQPSSLETIEALGETPEPSGETISALSETAAPVVEIQQVLLGPPAGLLESLTTADGKTWLQFDRPHGLAPGYRLPLIGAVVEEVPDLYELLLDRECSTALLGEVLEPSQSTLLAETDARRHLRRPLVSYQSAMFYAVTVQVSEPTRALGGGLFVGNTDDGPYYAAVLNVTSQGNNQVLAVYRIHQRQASLLAAKSLPLAVGQRYRLRLETVTQPPRLIATATSLADGNTVQVQTDLPGPPQGSVGIFSPYARIQFSDWFFRPM